MFDRDTGALLYFCGNYMKLDWSTFKFSWNFKCPAFTGPEKVSEFPIDLFFNVMEKSSFQESGFSRSIFIKIHKNNTVGLSAKNLNVLWKRLGLCKSPFYTSFYLQIYFW